MDKKTYESYEWFLDQLTPEQIESYGGREKIIASMRKNDLKASVFGIFNTIWWLIKGVIIILTVLFFIGEIFF